MRFWQKHMPTGMWLRSTWDASHISDPHKYVIDLRRPREEIWNALTDNCRSNIRRGFSRGSGFRT